MKIRPETVKTTGVLVAISIPIFTSQLEKSRESTDKANMRAAKAAAVTAYLSEEAPVWNAGAVVTTTLYYDAAAGKLVSEAPTGYGKGSTTDGGTEAYPGYTNTESYKDKYITVTMTTSGDATLAWAG